MILGRIGAIWGLGGILVMLSFAIYRLSGVTLDAFNYQFAWWHWALLLVNIIFMAHSEGYKGFQQGYSPRVVARAMSLLNNPHPARVVLAPLFCMGFFGATRRRLITTYVLTAGIVTLIYVFHHLPQPLRGVLDAGVVVGLTWGVLAIVVFAVRAFRGEPLSHSPELSGSD